MKEWKSTKQHMSLMNQKNRSISSRRMEDEIKAKKAKEKAAENRKKGASTIGMLLDWEESYDAELYSVHQIENVDVGRLSKFFFHNR